MNRSTTPYEIDYRNPEMVHRSQKFNIQHVLVMGEFAASEFDFPPIVILREFAPRTKRFITSEPEKDEGFFAFINGDGLYQVKYCYFLILFNFATSSDISKPKTTKIVGIMQKVITGKC